MPPDYGRFKAIVSIGPMKIVVTSTGTAQAQAARARKGNGQYAHAPLGSAPRYEVGGLDGMFRRGA
jgi:hypothetical protein